MKSFYDAINFEIKLNKMAHKTSIRSLLEPATRRRSCLKTVLFLFIFGLLGNQSYADQKTIIGKTAWIGIGGVSFSTLARIDTGARITSIHATDIKITDEHVVAQKNIGKTITFQTMNHDGKVQQITERITKVFIVRNSQGTEPRYVIELHLSWNQGNKKVEVNLRDRSKMTYKLLIGRNWLSKDFLVDVDMKAHEKRAK